MSLRVLPVLTPWFILSAPCTFPAIVIRFCLESIRISYSFMSWSFENVWFRGMKWPVVPNIIKLNILVQPSLWTSEHLSCHSRTIFFYEINDRGCIQGNLCSELCDYSFVSHVANSVNSWVSVDSSWSRSWRVSLNSIIVGSTIFHRDIFMRLVNISHFTTSILYPFPFATLATSGNKWGICQRISKSFIIFSSGLFSEFLA